VHCTCRLVYALFVHNILCHCAFILGSAAEKALHGLDGRHVTNQLIRSYSGVTLRLLMTFGTLMNGRLSGPFVNVSLGGALTCSPSRWSFARYRSRSRLALTLAQSVTMSLTLALVLGVQELITSDSYANQPPPPWPLTPCVCSVFMS